MLISTSGSGEREGHSSGKSRRKPPEPLTLDQMRKRLTPKAGSEGQGEGPTLDETLAWLRETIPLGMVQYVVNDNGRTITWTEQATAWSLESCTAAIGIVATVTIKEAPDAYVTITSRNSVSLGHLRDGAVGKADVGDERLTFISGDRSKYTMSVTSESQDIVRYVSSSPVSFPPKSERVATFSLSFVDRPSPASERVDRHCRVWDTLQSMRSKG